ncbi:hypothetical protein B296_00047589 [Ensete ventricosum]|uniref:Pirin C-terminal domain-containing protein n=1 Tax=Ensete ventricosum TaxID=4639 RepID=A0A426XW91_ENSVE|nr:hypothetical protein B296_00047589 [Ensete ventricosum]
MRVLLGFWISSGALRNLDPFLMLDEFSGSTLDLLFLLLFSGRSFHAPRFRRAQRHHQGRRFAAVDQPVLQGQDVTSPPLRPLIAFAVTCSPCLIPFPRMAPRYQELQSKDISRVQKDGVDVRIIAGESFGVRSPVYTQTPTMYLDFALQPGAQVHQRIPEGWNAFVYILEGEGVFGDPNASPATSHHTLVLSPGDGLSVWNRSAKPLRFVLIGGQPLNEPIVQHGPFVMTTQAEIQKAFEDYHFCKNGFENAKHWRSQQQQQQ